MTRYWFHNKQQKTLRILTRARLTRLNFISYFTVIQTKTYICQYQHCPNRFWINLCPKKRWSLSKIIFLDVEIRFRHTFSHSDFGNPRTLYVYTEIWFTVLATHSLQCSSCIPSIHCQRPLLKHVNNHTADNVNGVTFVTRKHMSTEGPIFVTKIKNALGNVSQRTNCLVFLDWRENFWWRWKRVTRSRLATAW